MAGDRAHRTAGPLSLFGSHHRARRATGRARQLRGLPHLASGATNAGGRPLETPFGVIHSTNITPDVATGIGAWSYSAFERAMRDGIHRDGRQLYPAFPYPHFAKTSDADLQALYAHLMAQQPVRADIPDNELDFRSTCAARGLERAIPQPPGAPSRHNPSSGIAAPTWRKASAIAAPVIPAQIAERPGAYLSGGHAEGWEAPPLTRFACADPVDESDLYLPICARVLRFHGVAAGPMAAIARISRSARSRHPCDGGHRARSNAMQFRISRCANRGTFVFAPRDRRLRQRGQRRRLPAIRNAAGEIGPALFGAERIARRMAGAAMAEAFDQIGAAIPDADFVGSGVNAPGWWNSVFHPAISGRMLNGNAQLVRRVLRRAPPAAPSDRRRAPADRHRSSWQNADRGTPDRAAGHRDECPRASRARKRDTTRRRCRSRHRA